MTRLFLLSIGLLAGLGSTQVIARSIATPAIAQNNCDPSYPDFCLAPPPPDLDCDDVGRQNFRVIGADPHRFDGDKDGIGCEPPPRN